MTSVPAEEVVVSATALARAGNWAAAVRLLAATETDDPRARAALALAAAEVAVDDDAFRGSCLAPQTIEAAEPLVNAANDPVLRWNLDLLQLRRSYLVEVLQPEGELRLGQNADNGAALVERAEQLFAIAPDRGRAGWVAFWRGLIADNLQAEQSKASAWYDQALTAAKDEHDELLESFALRHLGDHAEVAGDRSRARELWERSTELRARTGFVPGVLAQQVLLAGLLQAENEEAVARALAQEVERWARALDIPWLSKQAAELTAPAA
jgi:hypothetical protein